MAQFHHTGKMAIGLIVGALLFGGCGVAKVPETVKSASLVVEKDGPVTSYVVGVFDREYYKLQELRAMAQEETAAYNTAHQVGTETPVMVKQVSTLDEDSSTVVVAYRFKDADTYKDYSGNPFFYGTVRQAGEAGYDLEKLNQVLFDAKGKKSVVSSDLLTDKLAKKHLILVEEPARIYCPYQVAYVSESARVSEDGSVDTTGVDPEAFPVIILMSK